jgi:carboxynorspermidine decarboxylase
MEKYLQDVPTPSYICSTDKLKHNLEILAAVQERTGCKVLLALKAFAMFSVFPLLRQYLAGATASSLDEARLAFEEFGKEVHVYSPAYQESEFGELLGYADHLVFNSFSQWSRFRSRVAKANKPVSCGIRINPQHSEVQTELYDPCTRFSRLGVIAEEFRPELLEGIEGLHFHSLCGQTSDVLERTLAKVEKYFGQYLGKMSWVNFGGGHHITRRDYDVEHLCGLIRRIRDRYGVEVYLEPGEAVALNAGVLVATVLDIVRNEMEIAILDTSAAAHMPDVLEMPYRPQIVGAGLPGEYGHTYRLGGLTCLAGDVIGDYSFPQPLAVGQKLIFLDMAHYTMVKTNTFNGVRLPNIGIHDEASGKTTMVRRFAYEDYRNRLS